MKKIIKVFPIILMLFIVVFISGCGKELGGIQKDYNIDKKINGEEIKKNDLFSTLLKSVSEFKKTYYGHILLNIQYGNEKDISELMFDFRGDKIEDWKFYINIDANDLITEMFLLDGYAYTKVKINGETKKEKSNIKDDLKGTIEQNKERMLFNCLNLISLDDINDQSFYIELYQNITKYSENTEEHRFKAIIDAKSNLVIDYYDKDNGRVVFNENNKVIYLASKNQQSLKEIVFIYEQPKFNFPSKNGYKEVTKKD